MMKVCFYGTSILCYCVYYLCFHANVGVQGHLDFYIIQLLVAIIYLAKEKCSRVPFNQHNLFTIAISMSKNFLPFDV